MCGSPHIQTLAQLWKTAVLDNGARLGLGACRCGDAAGLKNPLWRLSNTVKQHYKTSVIDWVSQHLKRNDFQYWLQQKSLLTGENQHFLDSYSNSTSLGGKHGWYHQRVQAAGATQQLLNIFMHYRHQGTFQEQWKVFDLCRNDRLLQVLWHLLSADSSFDSDKRSNRIIKLNYLQTPVFFSLAH